MFLSNIEIIPDRKITKHLGLVQGSTVRAKHVGRDIMAGFKNRTLSMWEWVWIAGAFAVAFIICVLAVLLPMRFGEQRLLQKGI